MKTLQRIRRTFTYLVALAWVWFFTASQVLAQPPDAKKNEGGAADYTMSYVVVILGIVLGLLVVARASNRRDRVRPAHYVEKTAGEKEGH